MGNDEPPNRSIRGFLLVSIRGGCGGDDGGVDSGCGSSLFGLGATVDDDEETGLKKFNIEPFLTTSLGDLLSPAVGSVESLLPVGVILGSDGDSVSSFLVYCFFKDVSSAERRRFFGLGSLGEFSRVVLRFPYVRSGLARIRSAEGAEMLVLKSVRFKVVHGEIENRHTL